MGNFDNNDQKLPVLSESKRTEIDTLNKSMLYDDLLQFTTQNNLTDGVSVRELRNVSKYLDDIGLYSKVSLPESRNRAKTKTVQPFSVLLNKFPAMFDEFLHASKAKYSDEKQSRASSTPFASHKLKLSSKQYDQQGKDLPPDLS